MATKVEKDINNAILLTFFCSIKLYFIVYNIRTKKQVRFALLKAIPYLFVQFNSIS